MFPSTCDTLKASGYVFQDHATCKYCGEAIEWWKTPNGKMMPIDPMPRGSSDVVPHFKSCDENKRGIV